MKWQQARASKSIRHISLNFSLNYLKYYYHLEFIKSIEKKTIYSDNSFFVP